MPKMYKATFVLLTTMSLLLSVGAAAADPGPLTIPEVLKLLPDAASMDPFVLNAVIEAGGNVGLVDLEKDVSLTSVFLFLRAHPAWPPGAADEVDFARNARPADFVSALFDGDVPTEPSATRRSTLLHASHIRSVTINPARDGATGVVKFQAGELISGTVHFEASRGDTGWMITAFELPIRGLRLERPAGTWKLTRRPIEIGVGMLPIIHHGSTVPLPKNRITVVLGSDGIVTCGENRYDLSSDDKVAADRTITAFGAHLKRLSAAGAREPDSSSSLHLVLACKARAKWKFAQWIMQAAAAGKIYRIHFAAQHADRDEPGVITAFLPKDRHLAPMAIQEPELPKIKIKLFRRNIGQAWDEQYTYVRVDNTHNVSLPKGYPGRRDDKQKTSLYRSTLKELRATVATKLRAAAGLEVGGEIVAPPPKGGYVPVEDVLNMLAILLEAGITDVTFEGQAFPLTSRERAALPK